MTSESVEHRIIRLELRDAVERLVRVATKSRAAVTGFVFGADPAILIRFGNTTETGPELAALYLKLADLVEEKEASGLVIQDRIRPEEDSQ